MSCGWGEILLSQKSRRFPFELLRVDTATQLCGLSGLMSSASMTLRNDRFESGNYVMLESLIWISNQKLWSLIYRIECKTDTLTTTFVSKDWNSLQCGYIYYALNRNKKKSSTRIIRDFFDVCHWSQLLSFNFWFLTFII